MKRVALLIFGVLLSGCGTQAESPVAPIHPPQSAKADVFQGTSDEDRGISSKIHGKLVASDLSAEAQRVSVTTLNGKVTLLGNVAKEAEKSAVEKIAKEVAGPDRVVSKLEVSITYPLDYEGNPTYQPN